MSSDDADPTPPEEASADPEGEAAAPKRGRAGGARGRRAAAAAASGREADSNPGSQAGAPAEGGSDEAVDDAVAVAADAGEAAGDGAETAATDGTASAAPGAASATASPVASSAAPRSAAPGARAPSVSPPAATGSQGSLLARLPPVALIGAALGGLLVACSWLAPAPRGLGLTLAALAIGALGLAALATRRAEPPPAWGAILVALALAALSASGSPARFLAFDGLFRLAALASLYAAACVVLRRRPWRLALAVSVVALGACAAGWGIAANIRSDGPVTGPFGGAAAYAAVVGAGLAVTLALFLNERFRVLDPRSLPLARALLGVAGAGQAVALAMLAPRTAIIATVGGVIVALALGARIKPPLVAGLAILSAVVLSSMAILVPGSKTQSAAAAEVWQAGYRSLLERPVRGSGLGSFATVFPRQRPVALQADVTSAGSGLVELAVEQGALGMLSWLAVLVGLARAAGARLARAQARGPRVAAAAGAAVVLLASLWETVLPAAAPAVLLALLLALAVSSGPRPEARPLGSVGVMVMAALALLALVLLIPVAVRFSGERDRLSGEQALTAGRHAEAVELLKRASERLPLDAAAATGLARALTASGDAEGAATALAAARERVPSDPQLAAEEARAELRLGRAAQAEAALTRALELDPRNAALQLLALERELEAGQLEAASRRALAWKALDPHAFGKLAVTLRSRDGDGRMRLALATTAAERASVARSLFDEGQPQAAVRVWRAVLELEPADRAARLGLGRALVGAGDATGAIEVLSGLDGAEAAELRADAELGGGGAERALALLEPLAASGELSPHGEEVAVRALHSLADARRSSEFVKARLTRTGVTAPEAARLGTLWRKAGERGLALEVLEQASGLWPEALEVASEHAGLLMELGQPQEAVRRWRQLAMRRVDLAEPEWAQAAILRALGLDVEAALHEGKARELEGARQ